MAGITTRDLRDDLSFGSIVEGIDWETVEDEAVRQQLRDLFKEGGLIVFKDVEPSAKMQVAVSKVFGPFKDHPTKSTARTDEDEAHGVIDMRYVPSDDPDNDDGMVEIGGKRITRLSPWHFDHVYNDELNYAGVLRSPVVAPEVGRTGFMDGVAPASPTGRGGK